MSPLSLPEPLSGNNTTTPQRRPLDFKLADHPGGAEAMQVAQTLIEAGFEAFLAGGAVRDLVLERHPKDFDIATNAKPKQVLKLFKNTKKVGIAFGVVLVADFGETIEVATFRADQEYSDGRHPDGVIFTNAAEDAQRRDFTSNGLFFDLDKNEIVDYIGGLKDIEYKTLRAIGSPPARFKEDYLRMLRAIRFAVTLQFPIEDETWQALKEHGHHISSIARDRIHEELSRTFAQQNSDLALSLLKDSTLLEHCFPNHGNEWKTHEDLSSEGGELSTILALIFQNEKDRQRLESTLGDLRCPNPEKKRVMTFFQEKERLLQFEELDMADQKRTVRRFKKEDLLFYVERSTKHQANKDLIIQKINSWNTTDLHPEFLLMGKDLIASGIEKGPHIGKLLYDLETDVLNLHLNNQEECWAWIKSHSTNK